MTRTAISCYSWQLWQPRLQAATWCLTSPGRPQWPTRNSHAIESWDCLCLDLTGTLQGPKNSNIFRSKWIHPHSSSTDRYFASCDKSVKDLNMCFRPARGMRIHPLTARDALRRYTDLATMVNCWGYYLCIITHIEYFMHLYILNFFYKFQTTT